MIFFSMQLAHLHWSKIELEKEFLCQLFTILSFFYTGVASIQNYPGSARFSDNPPASALRNRPGTGGPTNEGNSPASIVNRSFHGGNSANPCKKKIYIYIYI